MSVALDAGIGTLNYAKQTAKGTVAAAAGTGVGTNRPKWVSGQLAAKSMLGSEEYLDGQRFASPAQYVDKVGGDVGELVLQAQPENGGLFAAQILGSDVVTGVADPYTHTVASSGTAGAWGSWWQKVGSTVGPERELFWDSKIAKLTMEVGRDQKVMHYQLAIMALVAGEVYAADPAKGEDATDPFYWTDVTGAVTFDGIVLTEAHGETLEIDTGMEAFYGDNIQPDQLIEKKGTITRTLQAIVTDVTLAKFRLAVYGTATPAAGAKPTKTVYKVSASTVYTKSATRTLRIDTPNIAVKPDDMVVAADPEGGAQELAFGGLCLKQGATAALTVTALTGDATAY